jgi:ankyrin repeat protein
MLAAGYSKTPEMVTLLLAKGADPLAKDTDGKKAIDFAEQNDEFKDTPAYQQLLKRSGE